MGLFDLFKKQAAPKQRTALTHTPYGDNATNLIYNLLFCDDLELYKTNTEAPYSYPFNILFSEASTVEDLQKIIDDTGTDTRIKILAYNSQYAKGHHPGNKELLAVIIEVGLEGGLDVLASFKNGTARYINQTGKILIWESTTDAKANELTEDLFAKSLQIVHQIGPWDQPRRPNPTSGNTRITFLVSDGLYFGEGPTNVLFNDQLASPALTSATRLMQYLTERSLQANE
ncbi:hypothetical protein [Chitinophaga filiformis]|uniref:Uncharacterized protein n=1 Tax=Chitinophaga filiformis TaxID=104663 RepID=A0ABY4HUY8_CHIFI|nr:hypothetical protein [Chitinophaga filiformis]UPK67610.1 hypothetical protein MYF79_21930 [Chitinophaga filiformis]